MKQIAAFYWNQGKKEISYLIVDATTFSKIDGPKLFKCANNQFETFSAKATDAIGDFFEAISSQREKGNEVKVIYKTVMPGSKAKFRKNLHKSPEEHSTFVHNLLMSFTQARGLDSHRVRSKLKNGELDVFKKALLNLHLLNNLKDGEHKHHLWTIAMHATKKTYKEKLTILWNHMQSTVLPKKDAKKAFEEWLQQKTG